MLFTNHYPSFISNNAKIFINDISLKDSLCEIKSNWRPDRYLLSNYPLEMNKDSIYYIKGFIEINHKFDAAELSDLGIFHAKKDKNIFTVSIPIYSLCNFLKLNNINRFELARKGKLLLNVGRPAINAQNIVYSGFLNQNSNNLNQPISQILYSGKDVIIGIVDYGFDYTHPNFYDYSGINFRIKQVWEQSNNNGDPPLDFSYGSEFSNQDDILNAQCDTRLETHGTVVAGIAAGSGVKTDFYGLAPNSELVLVSTTLTDAAIADGLRYIADYAEKENKPCVINFSIGSTIGPHDGTSAFDRLCDSIIKPGLIFTGAVGNSGDLDVYFENQFGDDESDTIVKTVIIPNAGSLTQIADLWGSKNSNFSIAVGLIDTISKKPIITSCYLNVNEMRDKVHTFKLEYDTLFYIAQIAFEYSLYNNKPSAMIQITSSVENKNVMPYIKVFSKEKMKIEGWSSQSFFSNLNISFPFISGNTSHTISEIGGTGKNILSVGAFCTKKYWTSYLGNNYDYGASAVVGDIAYFSSKGPTSDGRIKPDITCPGYGVVSSYNNYFYASYPPDYYKTFTVPFNNNNFFFGILQGTSIATPFLTGIIALMLEKNRNLNIEQIKTALFKTAIPSSAIPIPNNVWGWGVLNAEKGIESLQ
ncbi:MAG: S8 family serine peptidase [Bacteroidales bacterium]|nr:S8 family serine peptidase [Bacteroidales bacterium]